MNPVARSLLLATALAAPARAETLGLLPPVLGVTELYASETRSGLALSGYDPLTYRLGPAPAIGSAAHEAAYRGLSWRFLGPANRSAFMRDPDSFLPRIGGYDANAAASGRVVEADPRIFVLRDGRLYLFRSVASRAAFLADPKRAAEAEAGWPRLQDALVGG